MSKPLDELEEEFTRTELDLDQARLDGVSGPAFRTLFNTCKLKFLAFNRVREQSGMDPLPLPDSIRETTTTPSSQKAPDNAPSSSVRAALRSSSTRASSNRHCARTQVAVISETSFNQSPPRRKASEKQPVQQRRSKKELPRLETRGPSAQRAIEISSDESEDNDVVILSPRSVRQLKRTAQGSSQNIVGAASKIRSRAPAKYTVQSAPESQEDHNEAVEIDGDADEDGSAGNGVGAEVQDLDSVGPGAGMPGVLYGGAVSKGEGDETGVSERGCGDDTSLTCKEDNDCAYSTRLLRIAAFCTEQAAGWPSKFCCEVSRLFFALVDWERGNFFRDYGAEVPALPDHMRYDQRIELGDYAKTAGTRGKGVPNEVVECVRRVRSMAFNDARKLFGRNGLSALVVAMMDARISNEGFDSVFRLLVQELSCLLDGLLGTNHPGRPGTVLEFLEMESPDITNKCSRAIKCFSTIEHSTGLSNRALTKRKMDSGDEYPKDCAGEHKKRRVQI
ncbi:unnamed protein product [Peniophora sp. CBMAI 1063]|nr:unnamed protein product [Peniophora sp. CBMAI 1063]